MSRSRVGDAPFQSDLIAFAVTAATLLGAVTHAGLPLEHVQALGQAGSWTLLALLTLHGLVIGVVLVHALIATATPVLVERLGGRRLLAQAAVSLLQAAIIGVAMSRFGDAPEVFGWLGLVLVAIHFGWRWLFAKRHGWSRAALVQILGVASLGLGALLTALSFRSTGAAPEIAALAGLVSASLGWLVLSSGAYRSLVAAGFAETAQRATIDEPATRTRFARLLARLPRPRPGSSLRHLALARVLALAAAGTALLVAWIRRDLTTVWFAASVGLSATAVLAGLVLTARALMKPEAREDREGGATRRVGTITAQANERTVALATDDGAAREEPIDAALRERTVPRRRAHAQKSARRRLSARSATGGA